MLAGGSSDPAGSFCANFVRRDSRWELLYVLVGTQADTGSFDFANRFIRRIGLLRSW